MHVSPSKHRYLRVWQGLGEDVAQLLARADLEARQLDDPAGLLDQEQYRLLLEHLAQVGDAQGVGLDIGQQARPDDLGPLGQVAFYCHTPRQSTEQFWPHYGKLFGLLGTPVVVSDSGDFTVLEIHTPQLSDRALRLCIDETLSWLTAFGGQVVGLPAPILRLELPFAAPAYQERYAQLFRCPVHFKARRARVVLRRAWFEHALPTQDDQRMQQLQQQLVQLRAHTEAHTPLLARVRHLLLDSVPEQWPSLAEVAARLGLTERTLSRHLQHSGTSYRQLREDLRLRLAADLLAAGDTRAKALAYQLGFHDITAFRRAFKQWSGHTLGEYRALHQAGPSA